MKLVLFDIDGTLISSGGAGARSLDHAFREVLGIADAFRGISMAGKTDVQIIGEGLGRQGFSCDTGLIRAVTDSYLNRLETEIVQAEGKHLKPGVRDALDALASGRDQPVLLGLLTGNIERGARIKLEVFGLNRYFPSGAFGSDHEDRNQLLPVAVSRYEALSGGSIDFRSCVVIGDTPRDVECGRRYGALTLAVATGPYRVAELEAAGADACMKDLSDTAAFLEALGSGPALQRELVRVHRDAAQDAGGRVCGQQSVVIGRERSQADD